MENATYFSFIAQRDKNIFPILYVFMKKPFPYL